MTPLAGLEKDNILRPDSKLEKLSTLKPVLTSRRAP